MAAWRVLVGVWTPKRWDLSSTALSSYTKPPTPPLSPWIDRPRSPNNMSDTNGKASVKIESKPEDDVMADNRPPRRPPSHRLVRHVLRSRVEAMNALASLFDQLGTGVDKKVKASPHLAKKFGGGSTVVKSKVAGVDLSDEPETMEGWRYGVEVIAFLQKRGAKIPTLRQGPLEDEWAVSSEGEGGEDAGEQHVS